MIVRRLYLLLRCIVIILIAVLVILLTLSVYPGTLKYIGEKYIKTNGIEYSKINGSLLSHITLHDVKYTDALSIKTLKVKYNPLLLLAPRPIISKIKTNQLFIDPNKFPPSENNSSEFSIMPFSISKIQMHQSRLVMNDETLKFDIQASELTYKNELDVKKISAKLSSSYADATIDGKINSNNLYAQSSITPNKSISKEYLSFLDSPLKVVKINIDANLQKVIIKTHLNNLSLSSNKSLKFNKLDATLNYIVGEEDFALATNYIVSYEEFSSKVKQEALFTTDGSFSSDIKATVIKHTFALPSQIISAKVSGNAQNLKAKLTTGTLEFDVLTKDYKQFKIHSYSKGLGLSFIPELPELLQKDTVAFESNTLLNTSPLSLSGDFKAKDLYAKIEGDFELSETKQLYKATLYPNDDAEIFKAYNIKQFSPMKILAKREKDQQDFLSLDANKLQLTLHKEEEKLFGEGNLGLAHFRANGKLSDALDDKVDFSVKVSSINKFLSEFELLSEDEEVFFDGEADINATVFLSEDMKITSSIDIPWFMLKPDTQTNYLVEDFHTQSTFKDKKLTINNYNFNLLDHHIYSDKASKINFENNTTLNFKEFWIYDNLLLTGLLNPLDMQGELQLKSDHFSYESDEGNITAKADIKATLKANGEQDIQGTITLIDGIITYEPVSNHSLSDDIIIIQDIKEKKASKRSISIYVTALKALKYKTKNIDLDVRPDMLLMQKSDAPLALFGTLSIEKGTVTSSGKEFEFDKSEVYFNGSNPMNPYLNLNLHHYTLDYIDIEIYISNTLDSPVVILSSKPALSQNDIMSYILFGEPASATFGNEEGGGSSAPVSSILLATGLKQVLNDTTSVHIDTLNILTNEEGTLGYEIGTRFNKKMRMVYRNDMVSSVILQYSLSKSIRIDVDVRETGQGINIIYIKDF